MNRTISASLATGALAALLAVGAAAASKSDAQPAPKAGQVEVGEPVAYDDLRLHVGQRVVVHTKYKTTRTGMLMKFSQIELTLDIETPDGASEMTIPKDTVASVTLLSAPASK
jgi:hypothetical protein